MCEQQQSQPSPNATTNNNYNTNKKKKDLFYFLIGQIELDIRKHDVSQITCQFRLNESSNGLLVLGKTLVGIFQLRRRRQKDSTKKLVFLRSGKNRTRMDSKAEPFT